MLTGENGIINRTSEAKKTNETSEVIENIRLAYNNAQIGKHSGANEVFKDVIKSDLEKTYGTGNVTIDYSEQEQKYTIEITGKGLYEIQADGTVQKQGANIEVGTVTYVLKDSNNQIVSTPKIQGEGTVEIHFTPTLAGGTITGVTATAPEGLTISTPTLIGNEWVTTVSSNGTYAFTITGITTDGNKTTTQDVVVNKFSNLPSGLKIGSAVTYKPTRTYTWSAELCSSTKTPTTEDVILQTVASGSVTSGNTDMSITSWRVFSIDEENEIVELISRDPSPSRIFLGQAQGYNNAVYLLNNACNELYGGIITKKGKAYTIEGRNININDIETRMTQTALESAHSYGSTATWGNRTNAYTSNKNYPLIYAQEKESIINGTENTNQDALKLWEQTTPIARSATSDGSVLAETSLQPKQTSWCKDNSFMQGAFKAPVGLNEQDGQINTNYSVLMEKPFGKATHWLASRRVSLESDNCRFMVGCVENGSVSSCLMCYASGGTNGSTNFLRPIISLSYELITKNGSSFQVSSQD